ncbi:MAG: methionyl-tRNA formyltransferase [candidate division Zixibacteria bacterium]|nr:methionyl-tRNA formyltransferase [candidate division Zixibacteria bacterium]MBU1469395.1 methionyl-tRNA formyltransferase [candidate division Zixibacteria bacterium]MBU2624149.1 methionyl-tRNA formyltransferase [candidate division Zixibacteria bacterium]
MRLIFFGNPKFALPSLQRLASSPHEIMCVVTSPNRAAGRGRKLHVPEVKIAAEQYGLPVLQVEDLTDSSFLEKLAQLAAALFVVVAFRILPPELLAIPALGAINLHASLLPKYRGAAPINHAIMAGETETGVTTFQIKQKVDTGGILVQRKERILPDDTYDSLYDRLSLLGADVLLETVNGLEKGILEPAEQNPALASKAPKIKPEQGEIDWSQSAESINNRIRGFCSKPGAYTFRNGSKLKILRSEVLHAAKNSPEDGSLVMESGVDGLVVATGDGWLRLHEVQPAGKKRMKAEDYLRGYPPVSGEALG